MRLCPPLLRVRVAYLRGTFTADGKVSFPESTLNFEFEGSRHIFRIAPSSSRVSVSLGS